MVQIDIANKKILPDCEDWRKNADAKKMCKHVAKLLTMLDQTRATELLERTTREKDQWKFTAPD
jgi:hypothetical protein